MLKLEQTNADSAKAKVPGPPAYALVHAERNGAAVLIDTLVENGVTTVFGYPGGAVLPLYDALFTDGRQHILVRHEQAAVYRAEGYARSTERVGGVFVTSGPGVANTILGLLHAFSDSVPVVCISGQSPHCYPHRCISGVRRAGHYAASNRLVLPDSRRQRVVPTVRLEGGGG